MRIYNLFPLLGGKFSDWAPHLARAADLGFDHVFVNPIQYPGYSGSLYSVKDYFQFHPLLLDSASGLEPAAQFKAMAAQAGQLGLKLIVDLVVNHCAFDSELLREHPGWFRHKDGKPISPSCKEGDKTVFWKELIQFDHKHSRDKEGLFQFFTRVVDFLIELGFKGFRCDAAYQLPDSFWRRLIHETRRKHPGTIFLAETLGCSPSQTAQTGKAGFDCVLNSACWWDFQSPWLLEQYSLTRGAANSISFPESHDTLRLASELNGNIDGLKQRYLFAAFFSAGVMMPMGFEFGFCKKLHVVQTRPEDWEDTNIDLSAFIRAFNKSKAAIPIFQEDAPTELLPVNNPKILFLWKGSLAARQEALLILNTDISNKQHFFTRNLYEHIQAPGPLYDVSPEYPLDYLPTPYEYELRPGQGIVLITEPGRQ